MPPAGPRIVRVRQGEETIHDATVCEVHHTKMTLKPQQFVLGWPPSRPSQADEGSFPNRHRLFFDCVFHPERPQTQLRYECAKCNAAYEKWKAQPVGGANGSQPIRSETNSTSSAAGSRR
jgi:hypothetical protein